MSLEHEQITGPVLAAAIEVHRALGPGFLETDRLDLLVDEKVVVELKAVRELSDGHFAVVRSQLRAAGLRHGLLINFARPLLDAKRVLTPTDTGSGSPSR